MRQNYYKLADKYFISEIDSIRIQSEINKQNLDVLIKHIAVDPCISLFEDKALSLGSWFPISNNLWVHNTKHGFWISKSRLTLKAKKIFHEYNTCI